MGCKTSNVDHDFFQGICPWINPDNQFYFQSICIYVQPARKTGRQRSGTYTNCMYTCQGSKNHLPVQSSETLDQMMELTVHLCVRVCVCSGKKKDALCKCSVMKWHKFTCRCTCINVCWCYSGNGTKVEKIPVSKLVWQSQAFGEKNTTQGKSYTRDLRAIINTLTQTQVQCAFVRVRVFVNVAAALAQIYYSIDWARLTSHTGSKALSQQYTEKWLFICTPPYTHKLWTIEFAPGCTRTSTHTHT